MDSKPKICSSRYQLIRISGLSLKFQIIKDNALILLGKIWLKQKEPAWHQGGFAQQRGHDDFGIGMGGWEFLGKTIWD